MKKKTINNSGILSFWFILIASIFAIVLIGGNLSSPSKSLTTPKTQTLPIKKSFFVSPSPSPTPSPLPLAVSSGPCEFIPILMYHHIGPPKNWLYVDTVTFTSQMDYLVGKGYHTVTLPEIIAHLQAGQPLPEKPIALTFDDGYADMFTNAYPVLRDRGLKATFFIITQLVGGGDYLTWEQIQEMAGNSLMTIGDHTLTHRALPSLPGAQVQDEILSAQNILQGKINKPVNVFAFPFGSQTERDIKYLQDGNFVAAVSTEYGVSCAKLPYDLRRIRIGRSPLSSYGL